MIVGFEVNHLSWSNFNVLFVKLRDGILLKRTRYGTFQLLQFHFMGLQGERLV